MTTLMLWTLLVLAAAILALVWFTANTATRVERASPPSGTFVNVHGCRIHYVERGNGPVTLLMIHGLGGNTGNFLHSLVDRLATDFRVIVMDRPGSGYSTRPDDAPAGPHAQAELIAAFIHALGLDRPVLVGHSLGGAISLATAVANPQLVRGLALIAPLTQLIAEPPDVFKPLMVQRAAVRRAIGWTLATPLSIVRRDRVLDVVFGPDRVPADFALAGGGILGMRPSAFITASTDLVAVPDDLASLVPLYPTLQMPVGIIYGTADRILDYRAHGEGMRDVLPQLSLDLVEGAGHMIPLTMPDRVATFVRQVAERTTAGAAA